MKKWIAFILALAICLPLIACGESAQQTEPDAYNTSASTTDPTTGSTSAPTDPPTEPTTEPTTAPTTAPTTPTTTAPVETTTAPVSTPAVESLGDLDLVLGSQMPDFTIYDVYGNCYTLYELLQEKKAVMLNFWYINCPYCMLEFPDIQDAYERYSDQIEILAINPIDSAANIVAFQQKRGLTFPLCKDGPKLSNPFVQVGYPTTVIIDRYGIVSLIQIGAQGGPDIFGNAFAYYCSEDYETKLYDDLLDVGT